jgi:hypothetical protein
MRGGTKAKGKGVMPVSVEDCIQWLDHLDEGATIWDTDIKFIDRIRSALEVFTELTSADIRQDRLL